LAQNLCSNKRGGLGIRSLSKINEGANLKLCWELLQSNLQWPKFLRSRVLRKQSPISYHISSSIWSSIGHKYSEVIANTSWLLGDGSDINFWSDSWCGETLISALNIHPLDHHRLQATVSMFINNSFWNIPQSITQIFPNLYDIIDKATIPLVGKEDKFIWNKSHNGELSFKDAYLFHCNTGQNVHWAKLIRHS